jgi:hypothetical protein
MRRVGDPAGASSAIRSFVVVLGSLLAIAPLHAATVTFTIDVPPRTETEVCQYLEVELGRPGDTLAGFRARLDGDSHHFHLYDATDVPPRTKELVVGSVAECVLGDVVALVSADGPRVSVRFPRGVRLPWHGRQALVANYHVENRSDRHRRMRARVRLKLAPARPGDRLARRWGVYLDGIRVPPNTSAVFERSTVLEAPLEVFTLTGHMHSRGVMLRGTRDGEPWYELPNGRHPRLARFIPPLLVPAGTTIGLSCEYDNGVRRAVRTCDGVPCDLISGTGVEDAMCVMAGYVLTPLGDTADAAAELDPAR